MSRPGRAIFIKQLQWLLKADGRCIKASVAVLSMAALNQASGRNGRCQLADCRFHIAPCKPFTSGQAELFLARAGKATGCFIKAGRFIKADGRFIKAGNIKACQSNG